MSIVLASGAGIVVGAVLDALRFTHKVCRLLGEAIDQEMTLLA